MASFKAKFSVLQGLFAKNHREGGGFGPHPSGARVNDRYNAVHKLTLVTLRILRQQLLLVFCTLNNVYSFSHYLHLHPTCGGSYTKRQDLFSWCGVPYNE